MPARLVVLISGNGSNLQAILDACSSGELDARVVSVISNKADAYGLVRAKNAGVEAIHFAKQENESRQDSDTRLAEFVTTKQPDYVILAGWMLILSSFFLSSFPNRVINLHPALPGMFPGAHAIERAFEAYQRGEIEHTGIMVHLVPNEGVDNGPVLATEIVPINKNDTMETLEQNVHKTEHRLLITTLRKLITGQSVSDFISTIQKGWWAFGLPGYRVRNSTYNIYAYNELPKIDINLDDSFGWLSELPAKKHSLAGNVYPTGEKPDLSKIEALQKNSKIKLPKDFVLFMQDTDLQAKIRSCTDCYLELPDFVVMTFGSEDGFLVHFLSDSQYVLHWFLYVNLIGEHCVLVSKNPYGVQGFDLPESIDVEIEPIWCCALSFKEFIYRFWLENEIWFTLVDKDRSLNSTESSYLMHYSK